MKKLLVLTLFGCFLSLQAKSQIQVSDQKIINEINEINLKLENCHKQYKIGTRLIVSGIGLGALSYLLISENKSPNSKDVGEKIGYLSAGLIPIGLIVQVDSHRLLVKRKNK